MSAFIPPRHDLRGGKASDDSLAISSSVLVASTNRCCFAAKTDELPVLIILGSRIRTWPGLRPVGRFALFSQKIGHNRDVGEVSTTTRALGSPQYRPGVTFVHLIVGISLNWLWVHIPIISSAKPRGNFEAQSSRLQQVAGHSEVSTEACRSLIHGGRT